MDTRAPKIAIIGLGYVGLPLAIEFAKHFDVTGFDVDAARISDLRQGFDKTLEVSSDDLRSATALAYTADPQDMRDATVYIITVPTPVDSNKQPDLGPVLAATLTVGALLSPGDVVIYESTVYPGATEEECVPILESRSGLTYNTDFFAGYSPERINPGDREHRVSNIVKVTSGSTAETADFVDQLYRKVVTVGTHRASSIRVAEAAKVIENTQRDVNIALINELAILFNRLDIDTEEVLLAAGSKWNFLPFRPGLVGGHCIGVDPYYLTHKAQSVGYHPEIILAGRRLNDSMGAYAVTQMIKAMTRNGIEVRNARILIMGLTFKENTPDLRNTRAVDLVREFREYGASVDVYDPWVSSADSAAQYGIQVIDAPTTGTYDGIVIAVGHNEFRELGEDGIRSFGRAKHILYDLKYILPATSSDLRL